MDIKTHIRLQNERAKNFCTECGGNKKIRIAATGSKRFDYAKCKTCNGTGEMPQTKATAYEKLTQPWREEIARIVGRK